MWTHTDKSIRQDLEGIVCVGLCTWQRTQGRRVEEAAARTFRMSENNSTKGVYRWFFRAFFPLRNIAKPSEENQQKYLILHDCI